MWNALKRTPGRWIAAAGGLALLGVAIAAAVGVWNSHRATAADGKSAAPQGGKANLGFRTAEAAAGGSSSQVETTPVEVVRRAAGLAVTGTLAADERSAVAANVSGIVAEVRVDRGSAVKRGDVLVQIDPADARNKLAEGEALVEELRTRLGLDETPEPFRPENQPEVKMAKAAWQLAELSLKRTTELHQQRLISTEAFDQARTEHESASHRYQQALHQVRQSYQAYKTALARLAMLKKAVDDTTITAPFDGLVAEKQVAVGEYVSSGPQSTKVATVVRIDPIRVVLNVPQQNVAAVRAGQKAAFEADSFPGRQFEATVRYIAPVVTADTRTLLVEAVAANPEGLLRPGLFVTAELALGDQTRQLLVPQTAVEKTGEAARVFVVQDGAIREQVVALGAVRGTKVEIASGLSGSETLAADARKVRDGERVRP
jgi:RND family efflux transporter MFP subunit